MILVLAAICCFAALVVLVLAVTSPSTSRAEVSASLAYIRQSGRGSGLTTPTDAAFSSRVVAPALDRLRRLAVALSPAGTAAKFTRKLDLAGNPRGWTADRVLAYKGLGLVLAGAATLVLAPGALGFVYAALAAAAGFFAPDVWLYNTAIKRQDEIRKSLPDALDLLTVCVEAGLGFDAALSQVARNTRGPLAGEFYRVLQEIQIGKSRSESFSALSQRTTVAELHAFVSGLVQADALGIPIANVLREQAKEMRVKRHQRAEESAQKVALKIVFPMMLFIMPALFIVIMGPGAITYMQNF